MRKAVNNILVTCFIIMFAVVGIGGYTAFADNNHTDVYWVFNVSNLDTSFQYVARRDKTDSSYMYVQFRTKSSGLTSIYVKPQYYGTKPDGSVGYGEAGYATADKYGSSRLFKLTTASTTSNSAKYSISNYVYEMGYRSGRLGFRGAVGNGTATGYWSVDSVGTYTLP